MLFCLWSTKGGRRGKGGKEEMEGRKEEEKRWRWSWGVGVGVGPGMHYLELVFNGHFQRLFEEQPVNRCDTDTRTSD